MISENSTNHRVCLLAAAVAMACYTFGNAAWAQAATPPNAGTILQTLPPPAVQRGNDPPAPDASGMQTPRSSADAGPKVLVKGFVIRGNTSIATPVLLAVLKPFENRELTIGEIADAAAAVQERYRSADYFVAQAFVPSQDISSGTVEIRVLEGAIGDAKGVLVPGARVSQQRVDQYLTLLPKGTVITDKSVERPLLLLNDLPGTKIHSVLRPGAELGSADLQVDVGPDDRSAFGGSVFVDNFGSRSTGEIRIGVDLEGRGLLGFGELLTATVFRAGSLTTVGRIGATLPVGPLGTKLSVGLTGLNYKLGGAFAPLGGKGDAAVATMLVQHPFIRSRNTNLLLLLGVDYKRVSDIQSTGSAANDRQITLARLGASGDYRDELGGGALNSYSISLFGGNNRFSTDSNKAADAARGDNTSGNFSKIQFEYQRLQSLASLLSNADSLYLALRGQVSLSKNLDSTEKASLGGPHNVRAYSGSTFPSDDITIVTAELRHRLTGDGFKPFGGNVVLTGFIDHGTAKLFHSPGVSHAAGNNHTLDAAGVGVSVVRKDNFEFRVDVATQIGARLTDGDDNRRTRVWALLQKWF